MSTATQAPLRPLDRLMPRAWQPLLFGLIAVALFALTIPMTRMANGSMSHPQWPPLFVASARAALAGMLALAHLRWVKAARPTRAQAPWLLGVILGGVLGFPLGMGWAVRIVPASHAAVLTGLLPLATAALAAWWLGHRPRWGFWLTGMMGAGLMVAFVLTSTVHDSPPAQVWWADGVLLLALGGAAVAYASGARLAREMPSAHVMSWSLVVAWPLTVPLAWWFWPSELGGLQDAWLRISPGAWAGLLYVAVCSTWLGFFFWYAALARDAMRVSQLQLLQPFMAMVLAAWLLGEQIPAGSWAFAAAVLVTVALGQRLARTVPATRASPHPSSNETSWRQA
ncbi:MAG: DMT family transporter [Aquabacterium sp.]